jgi:16S rRNA (cytidine1402-2'-O)-methyltransferase
VLREVRLIAAEDTRHSRKLLTHFDIHTALTSYYEHNQRDKIGDVVAELQKGDVALISDAGMPGINDPGYLLVRAALDAGHQVSPIPGPSAPVAALAASGLPTDHFLYLGYPPPKSSARRRLFETVASLPYTLILLESPHRLQDTLQDLRSQLGNRQVAVAAELTKMYERFFRGELAAAIEFYKTEPARGEFTIVIGGAQPDLAKWDTRAVHAALRAGLKKNKKPTNLAKDIATKSGWPKSDVYDLLKEMQKE